MDQELAVVSSPPLDPYDDIPMLVDAAQTQRQPLLSCESDARSVEEAKGREESYPPPPLDRCVSPLTLPPSANALQPLSQMVSAPFNDLAADASLAVGT